MERERELRYTENAKQKRELLLLFGGSEAG